MKKDFMVVMDNQEVVCHPKFRLIFYTQSMATLSSSTTGTSSSGGSLDLKAVKKLYNAINVEYSSGALDQQVSQTKFISGGRFGSQL